MVNVSSGGLMPAVYSTCQLVELTMRMRERMGRVLVEPGRTMVIVPLRLTLFSGPALRRRVAISWPDFAGSGMAGDWAPPRPVANPMSPAPRKSAVSNRNRGTERTGMAIGGGRGV